MKKTFTFFAALLMLVVSMQAHPVTQEQAATVCRNFLAQKQANHAVESTEFQYLKTAFHNGEAYAYIFRCLPVGYVAISASDHFDPVVCYSFESDFLSNPGFDFAMEAYGNIITYQERIGKDFTDEVAARWQHYLAADFSAEPTRAVVVSPLITTKWNQGLYFNTYCPWDIHGDDGRVVTGCVATAMSQVMNYHGHPYTGLGGSSYIPQPYGRQTVRFFEQTYNYNAMPKVPSGYSNEMAKLLYHCGVAVQMGYSAGGSGAHSVTAAEAMRRHFKYDSAWICPRHLYDSIHEWHNALKTELDLRRPIYYSANNGQGGHAFVVDGYDEDSKFHVNWGWGGSGDSYFTISDNNPSDMMSYIYNAEAIRLAIPVTDAPGACHGSYRIDAANGTFYSGMPTRNYDPDTECQWMIAAPEASRYTFHFDRFETEENNDVLTIYNGPSVSDGVAGSFSGSTIPSNVTVNADSVLVTFTTDGQNQYKGFQISYNTITASQYCSDATINSAGPTTITDGSGDNPYRNNTVCTWTINVPNMSHCYFSFPQLEFGSGDFVEIYNATTTPATLLHRFDNQNYPESDVLSFNYGKMKVRFVADNWDVDNGFAITVEPVTAVNDYAGVSELRIYPNPVSNVLNINFFSEKSQPVTCTITDMSGRTVKSIQYQHNGGLFEEKMEVNELAKGIYMLRIQTDEGCSVEKFIHE